MTHPSDWTLVFVAFLWGCVGFRVASTLWTEQNPSPRQKVVLFIIGGPLMWVGFILWPVVKLIRWGYGRLA